MRITKGEVRYDAVTGEIVIEKLEMVDVHDGILRLGVQYLKDLLAQVPLDRNGMPERNPKV